MKIVLNKILSYRETLKTVLGGGVGEEATHNPATTAVAPLQMFTVLLISHLDVADTVSFPTHFRMITKSSPHPKSPEVTYMGGSDTGEPLHPRISQRHHKTQV